MNLKQARHNAGLSSHALCELIGIHHAALNRIENGKVTPNEKTREKIERILGQIEWPDEQFFTLREVRDLLRFTRSLLIRFGELQRTEDDYDSIDFVLSFMNSKRQLTKLKNGLDQIDQRNLEKIISTRKVKDN